MNPNKTRKVTIKDVLEVCELASMGINETIDGTRINPNEKIAEFLCDSGLLEDPGSREIQKKYQDNFRD